MQVAFANWIVDMIDIHYRYARDQLHTLVELAWVEVQLWWCDIKIAWYS